MNVADPGDAGARAFLAERPPAFDADQEPGRDRRPNCQCLVGPAVQRSPPLKPLGMPADMVRHESGDEIIAVVVARLAAKGEVYARVFAGLLEKLRPKLLVEERIVGPDVDEDVRHSCAVFDQRHGIVVSPQLLVVAKIAAKRLMPPRHLGRRHDRRKSRDATKSLRIAKRRSKRSVTAHRMAGDPLPGHVDGKLLLDQRGKLLGHIGPHPVIGRKGIAGGVDIESGAKAEIPAASRIGRNALAAGTRVRSHQDQSEIRAGGAILAFFGHVHRAAGKAGEKPDDWNLSPLSQPAAEGRWKSSSPSQSTTTHVCRPAAVRRGTCSRT